MSKLTATVRTQISVPPAPRRHCRRRLRRPPRGQGPGSTCPWTSQSLDRRNHHTFQPLLYQVALAVLSPADIAQPIRTILRRQQNTQVLMDEVVGIDVQCAPGGAGFRRQPALRLPGAGHRRRPTPISDTTTGRRWRRASNRSKMPLRFAAASCSPLNSPSAQMQEHGWHPPLNFVIIGGGPTGVELAGAIRDISQLFMRHDFRHIDPAQARVILLDAGPRVLAAYPPDLSAKAEAELARLGVEVHTNTNVTAVGPGWVEANGQRIEAAVTLWAAGVQASPLGKMLGAPVDRRGCVLVDDRLNPPGLPEVFVLGDLAHFEQDGHQVPGVAQPAMQMGDHVGK